MLNMLSYTIKKRLLALLLTIIFLNSLNAQPSDYGNWLIYFGNKKINEKWNLHHEIQYRNFNLLGDTEQLLIRTGLGYNLSENNNNMHIGYAYIYNEPYLLDTDQKQNFNEHRVYQQFITRQRFTRFNLIHRYRFEQRFFANDFRLRLRYFLSINMALNHNTMTDKTLYLSLYNELFIQTKGSDLIDRNRFFTGIGYRWSSKLRLEIGSMNQLLSDQSSRNQLNVVCFFNF